MSMPTQLNPESSGFGCVGFFISSQRRSAKEVHHVDERNCLDFLGPQRRIDRP
jgi:hypothetical protein